MLINAGASSTIPSKPVQVYKQEYVAPPPVKKSKSPHSYRPSHTLLKPIVYEKVIVIVYNI
jgi:hypothetical protein